jgi:hypothetical protein
MTDVKNKTKSFRGSFSDLSVFNEIENIEEKRIVEESTENNHGDIVWTSIQKQLIQISSS